MGCRERWVGRGLQAGTQSTVAHNHCEISNNYVNVQFTFNPIYSNVIIVL